MARAKKSDTPQNAPVVPRAPDELAERLIAIGYHTSECLLDINGSLHAPYDAEYEGIWALPSRLFQFPISVSRFDGVTQRTMRLRHPLLSDHPFVKHIEQALGVTLEADEGATNTWFHACDLTTKTHWRTLLETRQFTTTEDIAGAVALHLGSVYDDGINTKIARQMLAALGLAEPSDPLALLCKLNKPTSLTDEEKVTRWPVNYDRALTSPERAWTFVIGLERGWLTYRGRHIEWSPVGRERYAAGPEALFVQTESGQAAFAF
jgi:hypothetical protein